MNRTIIFSSFVIFIILLSSLEINAQRRNKAPKMRVGIMAGLNMSDLTSSKGLDVLNGLAFYNDKLEYIGFSDTKPFKLGFNAGFVAQIQMKPNSSWYWQPSLIYTTKGYKLESKDIDIDVNAHYVQLPLDIVYKYEITDDFRFLLQGGVFVGLGVYGESKFKDNNFKQHVDFPTPVIENDYTAFDQTVHGKTYNQDIDKTFSSEGIYSFDGGLQVGLGIEIKRIQFALNYQYSLMPLYNYKYDFSRRYKEIGIDNTKTSFEYFRIQTPSSPHQHVISFTVSYFFDKIDPRKRFRW